MTHVAKVIIYMSFCDICVQEKDALKRQLGETQAELSRRAADISMKELLAEKDEQIAGLLQEGELACAVL